MQLSLLYWNKENYAYNPFLKNNITEIKIFVGHNIKIQIISEQQIFILKHENSEYMRENRYKNL